MDNTEINHELARFIGLTDQSPPHKTFVETVEDDYTCLMHVVEALHKTGIRVLISQDAVTFSSETGEGVYMGLFSQPHDKLSSDNLYHALSELFRRFGKLVWKQHKSYDF